MTPTVFVAMSGGVDSSVAAALLKQQGFKVVGVFMKNWPASNAERSSAGWSDLIYTRTEYCSVEQDFADMRAVCQQLDIPYYTFNFEKEYKKQVLDYFFAEYKAGRTPNPDVMCNKEIKFGLFLKRAMALGADFIATGHYAQRVASHESRVASGKTNSSLTRHSSLVTRHLLLKGADPIKDQTYFLYNLTQAQLSKTLFPIGQYPKKRVRALAKQFKLPTATKKDSQGICFIGPIDVKKFLKTVITQKKGKIVNLEGKVVGEHEGAWFYTIGQRRVAGLSGQTDPLYVISTDIKKNLVVVGPDSSTYGQGVVLKNLHLIEKVASRESRVAGEKHSTRHSSLVTRYLLTAKPRYGPEVYSGQLVIEEVASNESRGANGETIVIPASEPGSRQKNTPKQSPSRNSSLATHHSQLVTHNSLLATRYSFIFDAPVRALTPGQSLVLYDGSVCLGGGIIKKII